MGNNETIRTATDEIYLNVSSSKLGSWGFMAGPLRLSEHKTIVGEIYVESEQSSWLLEGRNGFEGKRFNVLQNDLRKLLSEGNGGVFFGDHDFGQLLHFTGKDGSFWVEADLPSENEFDIFLTYLDSDDFEWFFGQLAEIESRFGPLEALDPGCCYIPETTYYS